MARRKTKKSTTPIPKQQIIRGPECHFDGRTPPVAWPTVSLCMIVKNEADNLAACLESVGDFASEIIIVDTGSTDRTVEIAESFGARVKYFPWANDFAAARNESIKDAVGDWIFWMDADDRLTPKGVAQLKQAVVSGHGDVYMCRVVSQGLQVGSSDAYVEHLRLFRNHLGIRFQSPLHESIMSDVIRKHLTLARTNITVAHTGYKIKVEDYKAKAKRNLAIINEALARKPHSLYWRYHRGTVLSVLDEKEQAAEDYQAVVDNPPPELHWDIYVYQAHTGLVEMYHDLGRVDDARRVLELALERFPRRRHLAIAAAIFYLAQDELDAALESLTRAQTLPHDSDALGQAWPPGKLEWVLGQVYLWQGKLQLAQEAYQTMLRKMGLQLQTTPPSQWQLVQAKLKTQDYDAVFDLLDPIAYGNPMALRLLARADDKRGRWRNAAACLSQAIALTGAQPGEWVELAEFVLHTRHFCTAEQLCHQALAENPDDADALNLLGFIAIQRNDAKQAMTYLLQAKLAAPDHHWIRQNLEQLAAALHLSLEEAVRRHGARMIAQKEYAFAATAFTMLIQMAPRDVGAYKSLAVALNNLGQSAEAMFAWETAERLVNENV